MKRDWPLWALVTVVVVALGLGSATRFVVGTAWGLGERANGDDQSGGPQVRVLGVVEAGVFVPLPYGYSRKAGTLRVAALRLGSTPDSARPDLAEYEGKLLVVDGLRSGGFIFDVRITRVIDHPVWTPYLQWAWRN